MSDPSFDLSKTRHQLRTPINHIIGYCEMLLEENGCRNVFIRISQYSREWKRFFGIDPHHFDEPTVADPKNLQKLQHELRTPVNHIISYSELLEDYAAEIGLERLAPDLKRIRDAARDWLTLMEELLIPADVASTRTLPPAFLARHCWLWPHPASLFTRCAPAWRTNPRIGRHESSSWTTTRPIATCSPAGSNAYGATVTSATTACTACKCFARNS